MRVADVMTRDVKTVTRDTPFTDVARLLRRHGISSVVVVEASGKPTGIATERDVVQLVADGLDPATSSVGERTPDELITIRPRAELTEAAETMAELGIRHLPVVDRGKLVGIVSIRDVAGWAVDELTGGHELADLEGVSVALAAVQVARRGRPRPPAA